MWRPRSHDCQVLWAYRGLGNPGNKQDVSAISAEPMHPRRPRRRPPQSLQRASSTSMWRRGRRGQAQQSIATLVQTDAGRWLPASRHIAEIHMERIGNLETKINHGCDSHAVRVVRSCSKESTLSRKPAFQSGPRPLPTSSERG